MISAVSEESSIRSHPALVLCPSRVPEKVDLNQKHKYKMILPSEIQEYNNRMQLTKWC